MSAASDLEFLRKLQRLLSEGEFVATYKFALLQALADLSVEQQLAANKRGGLLVPLADIAEKFLEYYWRQAVPFAPNLEQEGVLRQNNGRQAAVINSIAETRGQYSSSIHLVKRNVPEWKRLKRRVTVTIIEQPLWKLQKVGGIVDDFLYQQEYLVNGCIQLQQGVQGAFRSFHGLITNLIRGGWLNHIRRISSNRDLLGERGDLAEFLFGSERRSLEGFRVAMREHQAGFCFYCSKQVHREGVADHFIPWSRYPVDLGHNFVFSHSACNNQKRDFLGHPEHLAHWREHNLDRASELEDVFESSGLAHDAERSRFVAVWSYEQGEQSSAHTYLTKDNYPALDRSWRDVLL